MPEFKTSNRFSNQSKNHELAENFLRLFKDVGLLEPKELHAPINYKLYTTLLDCSCTQVKTFFDLLEYNTENLMEVEYATPSHDVLISRLDEIVDDELGKNISLPPNVKLASALAYTDKCSPFLSVITNDVAGFIASDDSKIDKNGLLQIRHFVNKLHLSNRERVLLPRGSFGLLIRVLTECRLENKSVISTCTEIINHPYYTDICNAMSPHFDATTDSPVVLESWYEFDFLLMRQIAKDIAAQGITKDKLCFALYHDMGTIEHLTDCNPQLQFHYEYIKVNIYGNKKYVEQFLSYI